MGLTLSTFRQAVHAPRIETSHVRFSAPVPAGTELFLNADADGTRVTFDVVTDDGAPVLSGTATVAEH